MTIPNKNNEWKLFENGYKIFTTVFVPNYAESFGCFIITMPHSLIDDKN